MRGVNELFSSPPDGLTIGMINDSVLITNDIIGIKKAKIAKIKFFVRVRRSALGTMKA